MSIIQSGNDQGELTILNEVLKSIMDIDWQRKALTIYMEVITYIQKHDLARERGTASRK